MRVYMEIEGTALAAMLDDTEVARDFASLLPLAVSASDYAGTEKVCDLPRALATAGAPAGSAASAGDIMHYAPWGNLALFHSNAPHARGLVRLGRFNDRVAAVAALRHPGPLNLTISVEGERR